MIVYLTFFRTGAVHEEEAAIMDQHIAFYAEVGRRIRCARERAGLTQDALAAQVALSRTSVTNIERGRQKMLLHTLWGAAQAMGVEPAGLLPEGPENPDLQAAEHEAKGGSLHAVPVLQSGKGRDERRAKAV
jgi:transcriptional regulator with XRE-family HTH domain